jgi:hypothetical protein
MSIRFLLPLACASLAHAHFTFVVPDSGGAKAKVIMSETLEPEQQVDVAIIGSTSLRLRDAGGNETPLKLIRAGNAYDVALNGSGTRVVHGVTDLGIVQRGAGKPHVLIYYPKTILGDAFDPKTVVAGQTPVEIVPIGNPGAVKLRLLARGKPRPDAEITVILPDGTQKKIKTDATGESEAFSQMGRFGVWARFWESTPGERDGKKYDEVRHYATLVFDAYPAASQAASLPEATSSFGAVESSGWLYVYGGHIAPTHTYWNEAVSGRFQRLNLSQYGKWDELRGGPALQGLNLAAYDGKIYRIGGMAPRNERGKAADNHSTAECARFDPATRQWEALPPLPKPRSSHDVVIVGSRLIVVGGWTMRGSAQEWLDTIAIMDLAAKTPEWKTAAQPFRRRALIGAAYQGKLYVIGGFDEKSRVVRTVSIYNPETGDWSEGPELPEGTGRAFAPAAVVHKGSLYTSVSDGTLLRLNEATRRWGKAGSATGRVAHRLASHGDTVLVIGGASGGKNFDRIEAITVAP